MAAVDDVQDHLQSQGLVDGATGWASVRRRVHDGQNQIVVLSEDGGTAPEISESSGIGDEALEDLGVQVLVRADPWDGDASRAKAQAILSDLHGRRDQTIGTTTYLRVRALTGEPVFAGFDDKHRPQHTVAFRLMKDV